MPRTRHLAYLLALMLAFPSAALAQGAGDDQYQDPFGDEPTAQTQQPNGDDGLSDEPPGDNGSSDSGSSGSSGGGGGTGSAGGSDSEQSTPAPTNALPNTGSDSRPLLLVGAAFVLMGIGLRLRTIDPDAF